MGYFFYYSQLAKAMSGLYKVNSQRLIVCLKACMKSSAGVCAEQQNLTLNQPIAMYGTIYEHRIWCKLFIARSAVYKINIMLDFIFSTWLKSTLLSF